MKRAIFTTFVLLVLSGCGSSPYKYDPTKSAALNYATAGRVVNAGKQIKDVPRETIKQALERDGLDPDTELAIGAGLASAKYAGLMAATPGISNALGGSIFFLHALFKSSYEPHLRHGYFAWMPTNMAKNEEEAADRLKSIMIDAFKKALPEGVTIKPVSRTYDPPLYIQYTKTHLTLEGGNTHCVLKDDEDACELVIRVDEPDINNSPSFLAHKKSYAWLRLKDEPRILEYRVAACKYKETSYSCLGGAKYYASLEFRQRLTSFLPDWMYYYSPPTKERPYPVILNKGNVYYFIEPEQKEKVGTSKESMS